MPGFIEGIKKASDIALSHIKRASGRGRFAGGGGAFIRRATSFDRKTRVAGLHALSGAGVGAVIGGVTGGIDRDRRVVPGVIGGAFWGAAAGIGGLNVRRHVRRLHEKRMLMPAADQASRASVTSQIDWQKGFRNPRRNAAALVSAYGAFGFMRGNTRRKKHYTQFHHGETGRR